MTVLCAPIAWNGTPHNGLLCVCGVPLSCFQSAGSLTSMTKRHREMWGQTGCKSFGKFPSPHVTVCLPAQAGNACGTQGTQPFLGPPQYHTAKAWVWRHQVSCSSYVLVPASRPVGELSSWIFSPWTVSFPGAKYLHNYSGFMTWNSFNCTLIKQKIKKWRLQEESPVPPHTHT